MRGRMQPSFHPCDLVEFVSQIVESFRPYCEKKRLHLATQLDECSPGVLGHGKIRQGGL